MSMSSTLLLYVHHVFNLMAADISLEKSKVINLNTFYKWRWKRGKHSPTLRPFTPIPIQHWINRVMAGDSVFLINFTEINKSKYYNIVLNTTEYYIILSTLCKDII